MESRDIVRKILEESFPVEVQMVSQSDIEDIIDGVKFQSTTGGSAIDLSNAIDVLSSGAQLILVILQVYLLMKTDLRRKPTKAEVEKKLNDQRIALPESTRLDIIEKTFGELDSSKE